MTEDRSAQLRTEISSTYGFAIGVPSIGGSITPRHQSLFLYQLVLRYLEMYIRRRKSRTEPKSCTATIAIAGSRTDSAASPA
jgi:hypothetical protein